MLETEKNERMQELASAEVASSELAQENQSEKETKVGPFLSWSKAFYS
jgi:hypothetical protein